MYWLLSLLFFSVISISDTSINPAKDHLLIEHSVSSESAKDAVLKLVPDLSKLFWLVNFTFYHL